MEGAPHGPGPEERSKPVQDRLNSPDPDFDALFNRPSADNAQLVPYSRPDASPETTNSALSPASNRNTATATLERPEAQTSINQLAPPEGGIPVPESGTGQDPLRVVLTSLDQNVDSFAREAAHEKLSKKHEGGFWKRMAKSVWHNLTREYQVVKATREARQEILENENLLHHHGKSDEQWREATIMRYGSDYANHLTDEGESLHKLGPEAMDDPNTQKIRSDVQDIMREVAMGKVVDDDSLQMMVDRAVEGWREKGISQDYIGEGQFLAENIGRKARELEAMVNSAQGLSDVEKALLIEERVGGLELVLGEARVGSRTEIDSTVSERIAEKLRGVPFLNEGRIARVTALVGNEAVVAASVSVLGYAAKRGFSAAGSVVMPGLAAGIVAGVRERRALIEERALEARRLDADAEQDPSNKARSELGEALYEARSADELIAELGTLYNEQGELNIMDRPSLDRALTLQAEIRTRIQISNREGARLISFGDMQNMEDKRYQLASALAKTRTDLEKMLQNPVAQAMLDLKAGDTLATLSADYESVIAGELRGGMTDKDRLFNKLVRKRVLKRVVATTLVGSSVALGADAAVDAAYTTAHTATSVAHTVDDFMEGMFGEPQEPELQLASNETPDHLGTSAPDHVGTPDHIGSTSTPDQVGTSPAPDHVGGQPAPDQIGTPGTPDHIGTQPGIPDHLGTVEGIDWAGSTDISDASKLTMPEGFKAEVDGNTITVTTPEGQKISGIELNKDGSLSAASQELLRSKGLNVIDHQEVVRGKPDIQTAKVAPSEFVQRHSDEMKKIRVTKWFDNNTSRFDLNELGLQNRMDSNGNIVISIKGMTEGGSFHGRSGVNWMEAAKDGHMKVYLSASEGTQSRAFEVQFSENGKAVIDKDSAARALFNDNGKFIGGYQQAALNGGEGKGGAEKIAVLATVVGKDTPKITDTIQTPTFQTAHHYVVAPLMEPTSVSAPVESPPFLPYVAATTRRTLGEAERRETPTPPQQSLPTQPVPALPAAPTPSLSTPALPAAPTQRNPQADAFAASNGLPAAPTAGPEASAADAGGDSGPSSGQGQPESGGQQEGFSGNEQQILRDIDNETRPLPPEFAGIDMQTLSTRQRKFATLLLYKALDTFPRTSGESQSAYVRRIRQNLRRGAQRGRARLATASPTMVRFASQVFNVFDSL